MTPPENGRRLAPFDRRDGIELSTARAPDVNMTQKENHEPFGSVDRSSEANIEVRHEDEAVGGRSLARALILAAGVVVVLFTALIMSATGTTDYLLQLPLLNVDGPRGKLILKIVVILFGAMVVVCVRWIFVLLRQHQGQGGGSMK